MDVKLNKQTLLYHGRFFDFVSENITLKTGVNVDIDIIKHPGASAIVPLTKDNHIILIKQYRHAVGGFIWEIPAGTFDENEEPLSCAKRELIEETGFKAHNWKKIGEITPVPAYSNERIHIFLADELEPAKQDLESDEILDVHKIKLDTAVEMVGTGKIQDAKTISGLFMVFNHLKRI